MQWLASALFCLAFLSWGFALGTLVMGRIYRRALQIRTVETIEDSEGNMRYTIELGRLRKTRKESLWFWHLRALREGASTVTGEHTFAHGAVRIEGLPVDAPQGVLLFECETRGGPLPSRDDAYGEALRALEAMR